MLVNSLLYHDVIPAGEPLQSGFQDPIATRYKLTTEQFQEHLRAIETRAKQTAPSILKLGQISEPSTFLMTFDDGGTSFLSPIADWLDERNWCGHFFITTDFINTPGFLSAEEIRELHARGHIIGSHSCSHPKRISSLSREELVQEWRDSVDLLGEILQEEVTVASIPGGYYSAMVAETAAEAGIRHLMTSEPVSQTWTVNECTLYGRFSVVNTSLASTTAQIAAGDKLPRWKQRAVWNAKKTMKFCLGGAYRNLSESVWSNKAKQEV